MLTERKVILDKFNAKMTALKNEQSVQESGAKVILLRKRINGIESQKSQETSEKQTLQ